MPHYSTIFHIPAYSIHLLIIPVPLFYSMPLPSVPRLDLFPHLWSSALSLALICYVFVISLEKIFAKRHGYPVKANQELYALGLTNALTSLFPAYPFGASLSRSSLCEMLGAKTQVRELVNVKILASDPTSCRT